ncbi:MAG: hypothetical protein ABI652_07040, partial [Acidobacteriota bacterium]
FDTAGDDEQLIYTSQWMLIAAPGGVLDLPAVADGASDVSGSQSQAPLWTDDYASVWRALKWRTPAAAP